MDRVAGFDGLSIGVQAWPGEGEPGVALVHATGFCKEVWSPVVEELRRAGVAGPVVAWDQRAHGDSGVPPGPFDWWDLGRDSIAVVECMSASGAPVGVGHSSGGAALVMAEVLAPGTFRSLVLIEPIITPPPYLYVDDHPLVTGALRRKASFASLDAARRNFSSKRPFVGWDERALDAYLTGCLEEREGEWRLKCRPESEAEYYRSGFAHDAWEHLGKVSVPTLVVAGERSDTHPPRFVAALTARLTGARWQIVPDASHFLPMERPAALATIIASVAAG